MRVGQEYYPNVLGILLSRMNLRTGMPSPFFIGHLELVGARKADKILHNKMHPYRGAFLVEVYFRPFRDHDVLIQKFVQVTLFQFSMMVSIIPYA